MDEGRIGKEDRDALKVLSDVPPPRKAHSYSQQLRPVGAGSHRKRRDRLGKHSLDDNRISSHVEHFYDSSSDDDFIPYASSSGCEVRSSSDDEGKECRPLPEFVAGGGDGVFALPIRSPVHPNRPPCVELRPHPLRETQVGKFLRTMACTDSQLWAGQECGVRVWNFKDSFESGLGGRARRGDEDAAPFYESANNTSPTMCIVVDAGNRLVFTGHKDGKIRTWRTDPPMEDNPIKEGLSWQAHKGPVLDLVITSFGKITKTLYLPGTP